MFLFLFFITQLLQQNNLLFSIISDYKINSYQSIYIILQNISNGMYKILQRIIEEMTTKVFSYFDYCLSNRGINLQCNRTYRLTNVDGAISSDM